jgi:hypothetical protein
MLTLTRSVTTFPSVSLPSHSGGLPVEVSLIAQLGHGQGNQIIEDTAARQRSHEAFVDALDEPSARIGGVDLARGDPSSLYTFVVGPQGHPFHCHAGHRVFTAVSGSAGAQLRFCTASPAQVAHDPKRFFKALRFVNIPADCLFTVRFGGATWHQFVPLRAGPHPALFALSCHTNELGGELAEPLRERVMANRADIPSLTEVLPQEIAAVLEDPAFDFERVPTVALSVDAAAVHWAGRLCTVVRGTLGRIRGAWARSRKSHGFLADNGGGRLVQELAIPPDDSLLRQQLPGRGAFQDTFSLVTEPGELGTRSARVALAAVLQGFLDNRPLGVSHLMRFRNALVRPLGLRTSPLGCPASSLLSRQSERWFAERYPVLDQRCTENDQRAQVLLGADDKHLAFRSCVGVHLRADGSAEFTLGTRVRTRNAFGLFYMAVVDPVHRSYVTPAMLRLAVDHAVRSLARDSAPDAVISSDAAVSFP